MLPVLDAPRALRLRELMSHYRHQERSMTTMLRDLQARLERSHAASLEHYADLQHECDERTTELVHVRMAISGVGAELAEHERRPEPGRLLSPSWHSLGA